MTWYANIEYPAKCCLVEHKKFSILHFAACSLCPPLPAHWVLFWKAVIVRFLCLSYITGGATFSGNELLKFIEKIQLNSQYIEAVY